MAREAALHSSAHPSIHPPSEAALASPAETPIPSSSRTATCDFRPAKSAAQLRARLPALRGQTGPFILRRNRTSLVPKRQNNLRKADSRTRLRSQTAKCSTAPLRALYNRITLPAAPALPRFNRGGSTEPSPRSNACRARLLRPTPHRGSHDPTRNTPSAPGAQNHRDPRFAFPAPRCQQRAP